MAKARSAGKPVTPPRQLLDWTIRKGQVVDRFSDGTFVPWDRLTGRDYPVRLGRVNAAVREVAQHGEPVRGPNFFSPGTRHTTIDEFPGHDLVMVCRRSGLRTTTARVFKNPRSNEPDADALAKSLEVLDAIELEINGSKSDPSDLAV